MMDPFNIPRTGSRSKQTHQSIGFVTGEKRRKKYLSLLPTKDFNVLRFIYLKQYLEIIMNGESSPHKSGDLFLCGFFLVLLS